LWLLGALRGAARWYLRRGAAAKLLIFMAAFFLPMAMYAYVKAPKVWDYAADPTQLIQEGANPLDLNLPNVPYFSLTSGKTVFYIGGFRMHGVHVYAVNQTTYLYYRDRGELALLLDLSGGDGTVFVVTAKADLTVMNFAVDHATLILPATRTPPSIPTWALPVICGLVGGRENPYDAWLEGTLPSVYKAACG